MRSISLRVDDRNGLDGHLCGTAAFKNDVRMRVNEIAASRASKQGAAYQRFAVAKDMLRVDLLLQFPFAPRAAKLSIEGLLGLRLGSELVLVPFDEFPSESGIQLFVHRHSV